jgi:pyruvate/2-oxoglutarate dehydrogenase complex dihydrolipoamide acyltransferase (E2) component
MQDVDVRVDQAFWASSILPEGVVQQWFIADGSIAETGDKMAEIRIEDSLHEITAPVRGRLKIVAAVNNIVEPGSLLGTLAVV